MRLSDINTMSEESFVSTLGGIFEHSPWVAEGVAGRRPFATVEALHDAMVHVVSLADEGDKLTLLRAHPDLAGKLARAGSLTSASRSEQKGAGLDQLNEEDYQRFDAVNRAYREKFGIPFIIAVKGHDRHSILAAFETRVENDLEVEKRTALAQVARIARFRLEALIAE
jgi:2-oxo-4-hydroxy-4-carboxy-5-ureidoimidazoline decarboxylase